MRIGNSYIPGFTALVCLMTLLGKSSADAAIRTNIGLSIPQFGGGANLTANLYAPDVALGTGPYPVISMLPGGGAGLSSVEWAALRLATNGYIVCLTLPQSSTENKYAAACQSGMDFLLSASNPYLAESLTNRVGICGWSLGGRSLVKVQDEDARVKCLVCWDNLAISEKGDAGSPQGSNLPIPVRTPRVPALGQASENGNSGSDVKLIGWKWWRDAGLPVAEIVFKNSSHFWWSGSGSTPQKYEAAHHYTQAWFDRWLKGDVSATTRLLATNVAGLTLTNLLSDSFKSAVFADGYDVADWKSFLAQGPGSGPFVGGRVTSWVVSGGSVDDNEVARAIDTDSAGNVYAVGTFLNTVAISGPSNVLSLTSAGAEDIFVVKTSPSGTLLWAKSFGGTDTDAAYDVAVNAADRVVVTGTFRGSVSFGAFVLNSPTTTSDFTARLDPNGNVEWAGVTGAATSGGVFPGECTTDAAGNVFIIGSFTGTANFGTFPMNAPGLNAFIARFQTNGACDWAVQSGGANSAARGVALATDGTGDLLVTGQFSGTAQFGTNNLVSAGTNDIWLARLTSAGAWKWAKAAGRTGEDYGRGVTTTSDGYAISGSFSTNASFFGLTNLASLGGKDLYAAKFNWADQLLWVRTFGTTGDDEGAEINADPDGGFLFAGSYRGTLRFGPTELTSAGARDYFIGRLAPNGSPLWALGPSGGPGDDVSYACAVDRQGNYFFSGFFATNAFFGYSVVTNAGLQDFIFGKIPRSAADLPSLSLTTAPPNLLLAWPGPSPAFALEESTNLVTWQPSAATSSLSNFLHRASVPIVGEKKFLRLRGP